MRYIWRSMEQPMYTMSAITPDNTESIGLCMLLYHIPDLTVLLARLHNVYGLHKALVRHLDEFACCFRHITNKERLVQVSMEATVVDSDIYVADIPIL